MPQIQVSDHVYDLAKRKADAAGFGSVDEYVARVLEDDENAETPNFDHLFTPKRLADLDTISGEVRAGGVTYTMDQVAEHLAQNRTDWIKANGQ